MKISSFGVTDLGRKRTVNEDCFFISPELDLFIVADGMGGHIAGEIASKLAVDIIVDIVRTEVNQANGDQKALLHPGQILDRAIQIANLKILETAQKRAELQGMGTTLAAVMVKGSTIHIANVGDSRVYRFRNRDGILLTSDHSWVNMQVQLGNMTPEEAKFHPMKNVITRALGTQKTVEVDIMAHLIKPGDTILLCSDGLSNLVGLNEMIQVLTRPGMSLERACNYLVQLANDRGGDDNITIILISFCSSEMNHTDVRGTDDDENEQDTEIISTNDVKKKFQNRKFPQYPP